MIEIAEIYLFNTDDKNPYLFVNDAAAFQSISAGDPADAQLNSLILRITGRPYFSTCFRGYLDYDVDLDFENYLPAQDTDFNQNAIYNYRLRLVKENDTKAFEDAATQLISKYASRNWQVCFKTFEDEWFICYGEFQIVNAVMNNTAIHTIELEALNAKENLFNIIVFNTAA